MHLLFLICNAVKILYFGSFYNSLHNKGAFCTLQNTPFAPQRGAAACNNIIERVHLECQLWWLLS
jgi:hypothetical protein